MKLLATPEANQEIETAVLLLKALKESHTLNIPIQHLYKQATAFTHFRRIEIIQKIPLQGITREILSQTTGIPDAAIQRHLRKLKSRHFVKENKGHVTIAIPDDAFSRALLQAAQNS